MFHTDHVSVKFRPEGYVFKLYPLFVALFVIIQIECIIFVNKQISIFGITTTLSGITFPINLLILAIVTHCYSKQSARQLIWINNIIILQFIAYSYFAHTMEWATGTSNSETINAFSQLLPLFIKSGIVSLLAENLAEFLFIALYNKHKNQRPELNRGIKSGLYQFYGLFKYCFMANLLMILISYTTIFWQYSFSNILALVFQVMLLKSFIDVLFSPLAIYLISKVKVIEGFDVHDFSGNNPFLFLMNYKYLNFNQVGTNEGNSNNR